MGLSAMYDNHGDIVEWYVISREKNAVDEAGEPYATTVSGCGSVRMAGYSSLLKTNCKTLDVRRHNASRL